MTIFAEIRKRSCLAIVPRYSKLLMPYYNTFDYYYLCFDQIV
jgi:hypothetical protein